MSEMLGSGSGEFSGAARNTSGFGKPTKKSILNQTTQPNTKLFGSNAAAPVFGQSGQKPKTQNPIARPKFKGSNAGGTSLLFGTPTATLASTGGKTRVGVFAPSNSSTPFGQSKPVETTFAQLSSNKFGAPQTSTAGTGSGIFSASPSGSGSGELSGAAGNKSEFGQPTTPAVLSQTKTSVFNQTTQPNTADAPVFDQKPTANPKLEDSNAGGTSSLFGTSTITSASTEGSFGQLNATTGGNTGGGVFASSNSNTSIQQSKPVGTPLVQSSSNIFGSPQTSTEDTGIFGANTTGSGSGSGSDEFSGAAENTSGFDQLQFYKPTAHAVLSQTKTSVFNQTTQPNTRLFGSTAAVPVFGQSGQIPSAHPTFEGRTCSPFGTLTPTLKPTGELFSLQNTSMEGIRDSGLFSSIYSNTSFQQSKPVEVPLARPSSTIFGAPQTSTADAEMFGASTTGTFAATSGFGATSAGDTNTKFIPVTDTDTYVSNGVTHTINTSHQSITDMKEYETKAFEELRFEYYFANHKNEQLGTVDGGIFEYPKSLFSFTTTISTSLFGANDNKPLFGTTSTTPALGDVMMKIQLFAAPSFFGTQTTRFDQTVFGQPNQNNLFYQNKPAFGFGSTQATGFGFGTNTSTNEHGLFGSKPSNTGFPMTTSVFGTNNTFGATSTAQPATGDLFGFKVLNEAPTTSLFNPTTNHLTGESKNTAKPGGKWREKTRK